VYHSGVCIYLYFGVARCDDQLKVFDDIVMVVKETVRSCGGSLSHHHGIGKKNSIMYDKVTSSVGKEMMRSLKEKIDPKNVFAAGNLIYQQKLNAKL
jgi:alkyldihydroxyacetonephosphate synthase